MAPTTTADRGRPSHDPAPESPACEPSPFAVFAACPHCDGELTPEHAHYRCRTCGWRDSCCD
ncbi:MAG: hypothetical protein AAFN30_14735 [Actinomycetota bacterium]